MTKTLTTKLDFEVLQKEYEAYRNDKTMPSDQVIKKPKAFTIEIDLEALQKEYDAYINHKTMPSDQTIETFETIDLIYFEFLKNGHQKTKHLEPGKTTTQEFVDTYLNTLSRKELLFFLEIAKVSIRFPKFILILKEKQVGENGEEACNTILEVATWIIQRTTKALMELLHEEIEKTERKLNP